MGESKKGVQAVLLFCIIKNTFFNAISPLSFFLA